MVKKIINNSGFAFMNTGKISSCKAKMSISGKNATGFCNSNTGEIIDSSSISKLKKGSKFLSSDRGNIGTSYFLNSKDKSIKNSKNEILTQKEDIQQAKKYLTIDLSNVHTENPELGSYTSISTKEDLIKFRDGVNNAIPEYVNGKFKLENNINLSEMKWQPIGSELSPFKGKFDGNGFAVRGFVVKDKIIHEAGFFGVIEGADIFNLTVDGIVKSGLYAGIMVGCNNGGNISACAAAGKVSSGNCAAGFVGKNTGNITECYCVGAVTLPDYAYILPAAASFVLLFALIGGLISWNLIDTAQAPLSAIMEQDPNIKKIAEDTPQEESSGNTLTIYCNQKLVAQNDTSSVVINYNNPSASTYSCKLTLRIDESDSDGAIIAESGLIPPGYNLEKLQLHKMSNGTTLEPATYEAYLTIEAYDPETQEKSNVQQRVITELKIEG